MSIKMFLDLIAEESYERVLIAKTVKSIIAAGSNS